MVPKRVCTINSSFPLTHFSDDFSSQEEEVNFINSFSEFQLIHPHYLGESYFEKFDLFNSFDEAKLRNFICNIEQVGVLIRILERHRKENMHLTTPNILSILFCFTTFRCTIVIKIGRIWYIYCGGNIVVLMTKIIKNIDVIYQRGFHHNDSFLWFLMMTSNQRRNIFASSVKDIKFGVCPMVSEDSKL